MNVSRRCIVVFVCLVCLCGAVSPVVGAPPGGSSSAGSVASQPGPQERFGGETLNQQDDTNSTKEYTIKVGLVEVPIGEAITQTIRFVVDKVIAGIASLINAFNEFILGLPAPGEPTDLSTWMTAGGAWTAVYAVYGIMSALAIALLTPSFMVATDTTDPRRRHERLVELGKAAFFIVLGIPVTAFCLHLGNELTLAVAPSGLEFLTSIEGIADLGVGLIFGVILILSKSTLAAVGVIMTVLIYILTFLVVAFWPLFWALRVQPEGSLKGFGYLGITLLPQLILLKFIQSGILRFLHEIPLDSLGGPLFKLVATTSGLVIALIGLPYIFLTKLLPGSFMVFGDGVSQATQKEGQTTAGETPGGKYTSQSAGGHSATGGYGPQSHGPTNTPQLAKNGGTSNAGPDSDRPSGGPRSSSPAPNGADENSSDSKQLGSGPKSSGPNG